MTRGDTALRYIDIEMPEWFILEVDRPLDLAAMVRYHGWYRERLIYHRRDV